MEGIATYTVCSKKLPEKINTFVCIYMKERIIICLTITKKKKFTIQQYYTIDLNQCNYAPKGIMIKYHTVNSLRKLFIGSI